MEESGNIVTVGVDSIEIATTSKLVGRPLLFEGTVVVGIKLVDASGNTVSHPPMQFRVPFRMHSIDDAVAKAYQVAEALGRGLSGAAHEALQELQSRHKENSADQGQ